MNRSPRCRAAIYTTTSFIQWRTPIPCARNCLRDITHIDYQNKFEEEDIIKHLKRKSLSPICIPNRRRSSALKDVRFCCGVCSKKFWSPHILKNHIKNIHWKDSLSKNK